MKKLILSLLLLFGGAGWVRAEAVIPVFANQATASKRTVVFNLIVDATDFTTPETGEAGGQPQISVDGAAWSNTGIGVLVAIGNGGYYAVVTQAAVATAGVTIHTRYKSANTAEARGDTLRVVADDPDIAKPYAVKSGVGFEWPIQIFTSAGAVVTTGTPTCTRGNDTITTASFAATTNSPSAMTSLGFSEITLSATDMTASYYVVLYCTLGSNPPYRTTFKIQTP